MKTKLCDLNPAAPSRLPAHTEGRGLKMTLRVGPRDGEGLMRRKDVSANPIAMLDAALPEAAR